MTFQIVLRNSGLSPAIDVSIAPRLYLLPRQENVIRSVDRLSSLASMLYDPEMAVEELLCGSKWRVVLLLGTFD